MKKYNKPTMKFHIVKTSTILAGSPTLNDSGTGATQLGRGRNNYFDEEDETLSW